MMPSVRWNHSSQPNNLSVIGSWCFVFTLLFLLRFSKGRGVIDCYYLLFRPFLPGSAQREWLQKASNLEKSSRLLLLEADNKRLRYSLRLAHSKPSLESAPIISRESSHWWEHLELGKGKLQNFKEGDVVLGPGGLVGHILSVTPLTAKVQLLTDPNSQLGVWVPRTRSHALLIGMGMHQPILRFLGKDINVQPGDLVTTSPYSILVPPNLPVGVIQSVNYETILVTEATVRLLAPVEAIDWVQVQLLQQKRSF
uniref:Cell shape-determining protein MreC n=1 Tax=Paulinella longichromatophora TaxID=1708747 RepID=A0A2H4ZPI1_9EUKA|nr:putative rod shape-determining protein [Paulinella longichromatophora]